MEIGEAQLDLGTDYKGRRITVHGSSELEGLVRSRASWSALNTYRDPNLHGDKIKLTESEFKEFAEYVKGINNFLRDFLRSRFSLEIPDWAELDSNSVVLLDASKSDCVMGAFYFQNQLIALSKNTLISRGDSLALLDFVHTLMHEIVHAQSAHEFKKDQKQSAQAPAYQKLRFVRNGLYYGKESNWLDEAVTELLAIEATQRYFKSKYNKDVTDSMAFSYTDYIERLFNWLYSVSGDDPNLKSEIFHALVLHKFGAVDTQELYSRFKKYNAAETLRQFSLFSELK